MADSRSASFPRASIASRAWSAGKRNSSTSRASRSADVCALAMRRPVRARQRALDGGRRSLISKVATWTRHVAAMRSAAARPVSTLRVLRREGLGKYVARRMRAAGNTPCALQGDRLPNIPLSVCSEELMALAAKPYFETTLLDLELDGEITRVLPRIVDRTGFESVSRVGEARVTHVTFRRWPRDPVRHPVEFDMPLLETNEEKCAQVKNGAYVHNMFTQNGLPLLLTAEGFPPFLAADMSRADAKGDLRMDQVELPAGASVRMTPLIRSLMRQKGDENFLVARAKRIRGIRGFGD